MESKNLSWPKGIRYLALVGLIAFILVVFFIARPSMNLIIIALLIAYLLSPIVRFFQRKLKMNRGWAVFCAYVFLLIFFVFVFSSIIPIISGKIQVFLATDWPTAINSVDAWLETLIQASETEEISVGGFTLDLTTPLIEIRKSLNNINPNSLKEITSLPNLSKIIQNAVSFSTNIVMQIVTTLILSLTTVMASIHFCKDGYKLKGWLIAIFPEKYQREAAELINRLIFVWHNYFAGELKLMLFIGVLTFVIYLALGLKWALLIGIIAGFCEVVPNIGPILACVPAIISAIIFGSSWLPINHFIMVILVVAAAIVIQQLENIVVVPRIMGSALNLHPVVIILGILILSTRLGLFGALLASPIIGSIKEVLYFLVQKIKDVDPYPELTPKIESSSSENTNLNAN